MYTKNMLKFGALIFLALPMLGSCGYPNNVGSPLPNLAILNIIYTPAGACPNMALINKSGSEIVVFTASGGVGSYATQQLQVYIQPGSAQALATAFAPPYTQQTLTSKGGSQSDTGNVSYSLGVRCSATSLEVTKSFTLLGNTTNTLTLVEDSAAPGGVTLSLN
ncbi:hypothetical protein FNU79_03200 [Deinococcus detaillensis]|uniref:Lipoprotein n=1 Tax=Deinococcus detaillensis TaxID=2592048 RepID=A0A553V5K5_9DEIO|nr:hypothetical protein [Deinococcus detaillensis]TSA87501.1 hypothetical protein FNU79_03200 [Deinococcus detaillensis]